MEWCITETNGAHVEALDGGSSWLLRLPPPRSGYANAQLDDYRDKNRPFRWRPGTRLKLSARFSVVGEQGGTAGFGFWNAPFGPGSGPRLRLPQAAWFFYASTASNLPLTAGDEPGNGWFASTIDAGTVRAMRWAPLLLPVLGLNQVSAFRRLLWPIVRHELGISFQRLSVKMDAWHDYELVWAPDRTVFKVDGVPVLLAPVSPRGPLGFVTWIDNQYMVATPTGRLGWGTESIAASQQLEIERIALDPPK